mmetsp:Transcript_12099/g.51996  ORF Transcript_12099/g.51996 Transcript_12099/m.51996 type:complete len:203 (-) Transcript_12099:2688-3296(-)
MHEPRRGQAVRRARVRLGREEGRAVHLARGGRAVRRTELRQNGGGCEIVQVRVARRRETVRLRGLRPPEKKGFDVRRARGHQRQAAVFGALVPPQGDRFRRAVQNARGEKAVPHGRVRQRRSLRQKGGLRQARAAPPLRRKRLRRSGVDARPVRRARGRSFKEAVRGARLRRRGGLGHEVRAPRGGRALRRDGLRQARRRRR